MQSSETLRHTDNAADPVRPVTDQEVAFFLENGWVLLKGLVPPPICQAMLEAGRPRLAHILEGNAPAAADLDSKDVVRTGNANEGKVTDIKQWVEWRGAVRDVRDPLFGNVALSPTMGRNLQRLFGREKKVGTRLYHDILTCKRPDNVSTPTSWHQDSPNFALDRPAISIWIALDEVKPEQGPVRYFSGSHRHGMLAAIPVQPIDLLDEYPEIKRLSLSPAHHMQVGDCTVHHGFTVHGASANSTPIPRWSYLVAYLQADARYTGQPNPDTDGFDLKRRHPIDHPSFPLLPE
jgi:hypothetical protein